MSGITLPAKLQEWITTGLFLLGVFTFVVHVARQLAAMLQATFWPPPQQQQQQQIDSSEDNEEDDDEEEKDPYKKPGPMEQLPAFLRRETVWKQLGMVAFAVVAAIWLFRGGGGHGTSPIYAGEFQRVHDKELGANYALSNEWVNLKHERVPLVDCEHYGSVDAVHEKVLGVRLFMPVTEVAPLGSGRSASKQPVDGTRERARNKCLLPQQLAKLDDHGSLHETHLQRPMFWECPWNHDEAPVEVVMIDTQGQRYYRVMMIQGNKKKGVCSAAPVLVSEKELLLAAHEWYQNMMVDAARRKVLPDPPVFCVEYLGIMGSGVYFTYNDEGGGWSLRLHPQQVRDLSDARQVSAIEYSFQFDFPYKLDKQYDVGEFEHATQVQVRALDPAKLILPSTSDLVSNDLGLVQWIPLASFANDTLTLEGDELLGYLHCQKVADKVAHSVAKKTVG